jgi:phage baseplate assembly protein V
MSLRQRLDQDMTDAERRIANIVIMGRIAELDAAGARVRVTTGDITTGWLPFATVRAGQDRTWHAPEPGEQVVVVCPCGDTNQGVVVGSVYRDAHPAPGDTEETSRTVFKDGAVLEYDREQHKHLLDVPAGGSITLRIGRTTLELRDDGATLTTPDLLVDCPTSKFTGHVEIAGGLSVYNSGDGGAADFVGDISHSDGDYNQKNGNHVLTSGDVTADGIGLKPHKHIEQGDGSPTSSSVA